MGIPAPALRAGRLPLQDRLPHFLLPALLAGALTLYLLMLGQPAGDHQDLDTYLEAGRNLLAGRPLYTVFLHHPFPDPTLRPAFIYPPLFAVVMTPFSLLPGGMVAWAWLLLTQAALAASLAVALRSLQASVPVIVASVSVSLTFYPLWVDAAQGQANLLVVLLTCLGIVWLAQNRPQGAAAIGVAAAIKLTPLLLIAWLLVERRFRAVAFVLAGFLGATAVGAALRPGDTVTFFRDVAPALARGTAFYNNQSLAGVLGRLFTTNPYTTPWLVLPVGILFAGAAILLGAWWWWSSRSEPDLLARGLTFLPLLLLLSTVTWPHHLVLLLPVAWLVIARLASRRWPPVQTLVFLGVIGCFDILSRWQPGPGFGQAGFGPAQTGDPMVLLAANSLFLGTLLIFVCGPWLLRSR